jgi:hypothetical protein
MTIASLPSSMTRRVEHFAGLPRTDQLSQQPPRRTAGARSSSGTVVLIVARADEDNESIARELQNRGYQVQLCNLRIDDGSNADWDRDLVSGQSAADNSGLPAAVLVKVLPAAARLKEDIVAVDGLSINRARREVRAGHDLIGLTKTEFNVLYLLASRPGVVFTRNEIVEACRGVDYPVTMRSVDVQVVSLRRKLGPAGKMLQTIRGVGYRLVSEKPL